MLRLLALVQKAPGIAPNQRFRYEQWSPYLSADHGIALEFAPFESPALTDVLYARGRRARKAALVLRDAWRRWRTRHRVDAFDGAVVVREASLIGGAWFERWLAAKGVPFVYDFDDAIWLPSTEGRNGWMSNLRVPEKVGPICRLASGVSVGNAYLAEFARGYNPRVAIVRTSIDDAGYPAIPEPDATAPFTVVWTGSHSTLAHLEELRPALETLATRMPIRLRVVCDVAPAPFTRVELDFVRWSAASEARDLAPGHVGVMPLPDNVAARGKCGCKALQYMAIGRPAVVSPVGVNRDIVVDGENGLWATTPDDWVRALEQLARDSEFRLRLGRAARRTVLDGYTARASAQAFATLARGAIGAAHARRTGAVQAARPLGRVSVMSD